MPNGSRFPTRVASLHNTVVLIGGSGRIQQLVGQATLAASGGRVVRVELKHAATLCAEERPYAIVVAEELYDFGGAELDALARDLNAGLVVAPDSVALPVLTALLQEEAVRLG